MASVLDTSPPTRASARLATLVFLRHGDDVLLLRHSPDSDRFAGLWNGVGGHVERGEDIREAARRELREEIGVEVRELRLRGVVHETGLVGHAYVVFLFVGAVEQRDVRPAPGLEVAWHPLAELDALPLVEDVAVFLPRLWDVGETFFATEVYDGADGRLSLRLSGERDVRQAVGEAARG